MTIEEFACKRYGVDVEEYINFIETCSLNRALIEEDYGEEKSDDFYSVLSFIDGFTAARLTKENVEI